MLDILNSMICWCQIFGQIFVVQQQHVAFFVMFVLHYVCVCYIMCVCYVMCVFRYVCVLCYVCVLHCVLSPTLIYSLDFIGIVFKYMTAKVTFFM